MSNLHVETIVANIVEHPGQIREIVLEQPDGWELPPFTPGAHLVIATPSGIDRPYSILSDPADRYTYTLGISLSAGSRGGSRSIFDHVGVGSTVLVSLPKNFFPLSPRVSKHVLIAGGIGITPMLSMASALAGASVAFELHFCVRTTGAVPFQAKLDALRAHGKVEVYASGGENVRRLSLPTLIDSLDDEATVYCCGSTRLAEDVKQATQHWKNPDRVRFERFEAAPPSDPVRTKDYVIRLARQDREITVPSGISMLRALREAGQSVVSGCEAGTCRACKINYRDAVVQHHDFFLSDADRETSLTLCVSRCISDKITLDL